METGRRTGNDMNMKENVEKVGVDVEEKPCDESFDLSGSLEGNFDLWSAHCADHSPCMHIMFSVVSSSI